VLIKFEVKWKCHTVQLVCVRQPKENTIIDNTFIYRCFRIILMHLQAIRQISYENISLYFMLTCEICRYTGKSDTLTLMKPPPEKANMSGNDVLHETD
jgi:hypothetical protein